MITLTLPDSPLSSEEAIEIMKHTVAGLGYRYERDEEGYDIYQDDVLLGRVVYPEQNDDNPRDYEKMHKLFINILKALQEAIEVTNDMGFWP